MATYAIGDLQGCFDAFERLLEHINYNPAQDKIWLVGDLVNRGPDSLATLKYIYQHRDNITTVLGNHDLHLLALSEGVRKMDNPGLQAILDSSQADTLLDWLRHQPLLHRDKSLNAAMVHAGISPQWTLKQARQHAAELHEVLRGNKYKKFLKHMYGNEPNEWRDDLDGWDRLRYITNSFTRMRYVDAHGRLDLKQNGKIGSQPDYLTPWFALKKREPIKSNIIFGHWASLGPYQFDNYYATDSACVWGGQLSALKLDDLEKFNGRDKDGQNNNRKKTGNNAPHWMSIPCPEAQSPN